LFDRRPAALLVVSGSAGESFARLNALEGIARSLLVGVIPLLALEALGSKEMVTRAYLGGRWLAIVGERPAVN